MSDYENVNTTPDYENVKVDYTPTLDEIREYITQLRGTGSSLAQAQADAIGAWFDRGIRAMKAEAWDEGANAGYSDNEHSNYTSNPYREAVTE